MPKMPTDRQWTQNHLVCVLGPFTVVNVCVICVYTGRKEQMRMRTQMNENLLQFLFFCTNSNDTFDILNDKTVTVSALPPSQSLSCVPFVCHLLLKMSL